MMEFDLSEWPDSLDLDEFCGTNETREEPLAKRQKTTIDCDDNDRLRTQIAGRLYPRDVTDAKLIGHSFDQKGLYIISL